MKTTLIPLIAFIGLISGFIAFTASEAVKKADAAPPEEEKCSLERQLPGMCPSNGNQFGAIYSLDGDPMVSIATSSGTPLQRIRTDEDVLYYPTEDYYAPVVGVAVNQVAYKGLLANAQTILQSNATYSNISRLEGNTIITTYVSVGMQEAFEQIKEFQDSSIAVVNYDGSILVNTSSMANGMQEYLERYFQSEADKNNPESETEAAGTPAVISPMDYFVGIHDASVSRQVGSSFKPITARVLSLCSDQLPPGYDITRTDFPDPGSVTLRSYKVSNWDADTAGKRQLSLAEAFIHSSNVYFLRFADAMGLEIFRSQLDSIFKTDQSIYTGTLELQPITNNDLYPEDQFIVYLPYGQSACVSGIRMASMYQLLDGSFYVPFDVAQVRTPDGEIIYNADPQQVNGYSYEVDMATDPVIDGLRQSFFSYICLDDGSIRSVLNDHDSELLLSGRLLAKSGTAIVGNGCQEEHTMALSVLNEEQNKIICTAFLDVHGDEVTYAEEIDKLLHVLERLEVFA